MTLLAYIDIRGFLFVAGLSIVVLLTVLGCRLVRRTRGRVKAVLSSSLVYAGLFAFFLTGFGPFVGRTERREYLMTWEVRSLPPDGHEESEVILAFVNFPGHHIGEYSDTLMEHLQDKTDDEVNVVFEVTLDYGKVRGVKPIEIAGLKSWQPEWSYSGTSGSPSRSPWE